MPSGRHYIRLLMRLLSYSDLSGGSLNCTVRVAVPAEYTCGQAMYNANKMMIDDNSFFII